MNKIKPYYIFFTVWYWIALAIVSIYFFYIDGFNLATIGMAVSSVLPVGFFLGLNLASQARTSPSQIFLTLLILVGALLLWTRFQEFGLVLMGLYAFSFVLWLLYLHWYSHLDVQESSVLILGNTLPELVFSTYENSPFYASSLLGKKIVYLFYRGNWCPVDMVQIKELTRQYSDMKDRGAEVILVSPQPFSETKKLAEKLAVDFRFLTDVDNKMACLLEIENKHGVPFIKQHKFNEDTVLPTVIIADEYGKIIYVDQTSNYRVRPEPDEYISTLATN